MSCAICEKRPPKRYCSAKGEKICAICCGREREVTIDCLSNCPHLIAARRYEAEHRKPLSGEEHPYTDVAVREDFVYERWPVIFGIASAILNFQVRHRDLTDRAVCTAIEAMAETLRTLGTGIYYERPPDAPVARGLYAQLSEFLQELRKNEGACSGMPELRDSDAFLLLVFLLRVAKQKTNGRSRSRAFLDFLRERFPLPAEATKETRRIIIP
jgi:hypothetical protein